MNEYKEIRASLQTFDILCCRHYNWFWRLIGHVAMVVRMPGDVLMVWESTQRNKWSGKSGTQLNLMSDWIQHFPGEVFVRRVKILDPIWQDVGYRHLDAYIERHRGEPYPDLKSKSGLWYMAKQVLDIGGKIVENSPDRVVRDCSDRIAHTLQYCRVLQPTLNPSEQEPDNFWSSKPLHTPVDKYRESGVLILGEEQIK